MAITPYRAKITDPANTPGWLREGTGQRLLYTFGLMIDCRMERLVQGTMARMPRSTIANWTAPLDAQLRIAGDRLLVPGITETRASLAARNQAAFPTWQLAGLPRSILANVAAYVLSLTPQIRTVATRYDRSTYPPTRLSSSWSTYAVGATTALAPVPAYGSPGLAGDFDWDSLSPISGSWGWWQGYVVVYSVAPNAWCKTAQGWGTGQTYTPSADGYYSAVSGGAYVASGTYSGTSQAWGAGGTYSGTGYYSAVSGGAYVGSATGSGPVQAWGVSVSVYFGLAFMGIVKQFKPQNVWVRSIVVSFSSSLFDPADTADGVDNPAGTFGQWSTVSAGAYVASRFANAVYGGAVL